MDLCDLACIEVTVKFHEHYMYIYLVELFNKHHSLLLVLLVSILCFVEHYITHTFTIPLDNKDHVSVSYKEIIQVHYLIKKDQEKSHYKLTPSVYSLKPTL